MEREVGGDWLVKWLGGEKRDGRGGGGEGASGERKARIW